MTISNDFLALNWQSLLRYIVLDSRVSSENTPVGKSSAVMIGIYRLKISVDFMAHCIADKDEFFIQVFPRFD